MAKQMIVHMGSYGSGKTELSLNEVLRMRAQGQSPTLVDLDIVNPYFRSGEHEDMLRKRGVDVLMPVYANTAVDVPALPAEIQQVFDGEKCCVFDVGGDPVGATALGRYARELIRHDAWVRCVVNTARPFTGTPGDIVEMAKLLMSQSRLKIDALVNNTHLACDTTPELIRKGYDIVCQAAQILGVGVEFTVIHGDMRLDDVGEIYRLDLYTRPEWLYG